jgi:SAM-dependent methyltransferase/3-polyprenyl-4-hydroxybenzoate decarboxylase
MSNQPELLRRATSIRAFDRGDVTTVLGRDGTAREFQGDSALLVREMLKALLAPRSIDGLVAHLETVAPGASEARGTIEQALRLLREAGAVAPMPESRAPERPPSLGRLVLGISGAVAAAHTPSLADRFLRRGFDVRVALTRAAQRFVSATTLRAITHQRVYRDLWAGTPDAPAPHIELAQWADVVLVAPASATTVSRIAEGDCSDLVSAIALSTKAPVLLAPSMNAAMHVSAPIARNLEQLVTDGFCILHPSVGVEVAEAPADRQPTFGSWPGLDDMVATVEHVWLRARQGGPVLRPGEAAAAWDAQYSGTPAERLPFHSDRLDDDLREVLEGIRRPATLWDLGTGLGTVAAEASRLGFTVTGTDLSPRAVALARERPGTNAVRLLVDDIRRSELEGTFDVVVDRGCFHSLDPAGARRWIDAVRQRTRPGSLVVLKLHREDEPGQWGTLRYRLHDLERLFGPEFEVRRWAASTFPGPHAPPMRAWLALLARRSPAA